MKLSIIKKMALLLVGLATVQGYAAENCETVTIPGVGGMYQRCSNGVVSNDTAYQYTTVSDSVCLTADCISQSSLSMHNLTISRNSYDLTISDQNFSGYDIKTRYTDYSGIL